MKSNFDLEMQKIESETRRIERDDFRFFVVLWVVCLFVLATALGWA